MSKAPKVLIELLKPMVKPLPKVLKPSVKPLHELIKPGKKEIGVRLPNARKGIRTVERDEFQKLKSDLLDGAKSVPSPSDYAGKAYQRPDGTLIGIRNSDEHGETIDVLRSLNEEVLKNGYKVHGK